MPKVIQKFLVFGDSLTDRQTMAKSVLAPFSGLEGKSKDGRFTNAYVWFEYFLRSLLGHAEVMGNDKVVGTKEAPDLARTYCVGGMTAYNYKKVSAGTELSLLRDEAKIVGITDILIETLTDPIESVVLASLEDMRNACLSDNQTLGVSAEDKESTLVIEWSGANDLITINQCPTVEAADLAVDARIQHVEALIEQGYKHFALFNLPGLDSTPRFKLGEAALRDAAQTSIQAFNTKLQEDITLLHTEHPGCTFQLFDVHTHFQEAYDNPVRYGFDEAKKTAIYTESTIFKAQGMSAPENGYLFWDRVHPMKRVHEILAGFFKTLFERHYTFELKPEDHIRQFQMRYGERLIADRTRKCGCCVRSKIDHQAEDLTVDQIMRHGLFGGGKRTLKVIQDLEWVTQDKKSTGKYPHIQKFFAEPEDREELLPDTNETDIAIVDGVVERRNSFDSVKL